MTMARKRRSSTDNKNMPPPQGPPIHAKGGGGGRELSHDPNLSEESSSDDDDDDDLGLEGVLVRNPDASSSSSSDDDDNDDASEDDDGEEQDDVNEDSNGNGNDNDSECDKKEKKAGKAESKASSKSESAPSAAKKAKSSSTTSSSPATNNKRSASPPHPKQQKNSKKSKRNKKSSDDNDDDLVQVDFTFHDMDEQFHDGLKALLHNSGTVYQPYAGNWVDLMIDNVSVGTLLSTEGDVDGNVYGFASVLNVNTTTAYCNAPAVQHLRDVCLQGCPPEHRDAFRTVFEDGKGGDHASSSSQQQQRRLSGPTGLLLHGRMINLPLEITLALHQQLVLDMEWAIQHAEGGPDERQSLDFATIVRVAPCQLEGNASVVHRYFDDEFFHNRAQLSFVIDAPKSYSKEQPQKLQVSVLTASAFRQAVRDLERMVGGGGSGV